MTAKEISKLRRALEMTPVELAAAIGVSYQTVYRWEAKGGIDGLALLIMEAIRDAVRRDSASRVATKLRQGLRYVVSYALTK